MRPIHRAERSASAVRRVDADGMLLRRDAAQFRRAAGPYRGCAAWRCKRNSSARLLQGESSARLYLTEYRELPSMSAFGVSRLGFQRPGLGRKLPFERSRPSPARSYRSLRGHSRPARSHLGRAVSGESEPNPPFRLRDWKALSAGRPRPWLGSAQTSRSRV